MSALSDAPTLCAYDPETLYRLAERAMEKLKVPRRWREDAVAEFVMAALEAGQSADGHGNVQAYQCLRGKGAVIDFLRREYRNEQLSPAACSKESSRISLDKEVPGMDDEPTTLAETVVDHDMPAPDARLLQEEREAAVNRALASLPVEQREAVRLIWQENMHQNEVARRLGIPRKVLRNRLLSAKTTLRKLLADYEDEYNRTRFSRK